MSPLAHLSDSTVRQIVGQQRYERAVLALSSGKIVERTAYSNNVFSGKWDVRPDAPIALMALENSQVVLDCTCDEFDPTNGCQHAVALALAWARAPHSFEIRDQAADFETLLDEYLGMVEVDLDGDIDEAEIVASLAANRPQPPTRPASARAAMPQVEHLTMTLTWQQPGLQAEYRQVLEGLTVSELRQIASQHGLKVPGAQREPIAEAIAEALGKPQAVVKAWRALTPPARLTLSLAAFMAPTSYLGGARFRQMLQMVDGKAAENLKSILQELQASGLVVEQYGRLTAPAGLHYLLPPEIHLVKPLAQTRDLRVVPAPHPLQFASWLLSLLLTVKNEAAQLRLNEPARPPQPNQLPEIGDWPIEPAEVEALLRDPNVRNKVYVQQLTVVPSGPLLSEASSRLLRTALNTSSEQIEFGLRVLSKLGLVVLVSGQPPAVLEEGLAQYLKHHPAEHISSVFNAWMSVRDWSELDWLSTPNSKLRLHRQGFFNYSYAQMIALIASARAYLSHQLRRAPAGTWLDLEAFVAAGRAFNLDQALWPMPPGITMTLGDRTLNLANANDWALFYRRFVEAILVGPLQWIGLVDLGYRKTELAAFRLTELGAFLLYQRDQYTVPPLATTGRALTYSPDGALLVQPAEAASDLLGLVSLLCEVRAGPKGLLAFRVTPAGAARAFEAGHQPDEILGLLAKHAGSPPPTALAQRLRDWWNHYGEAHIYQELALMELADDYALGELLASTSLSEYLLYRFSPRLVALRPEGVAAVREQLAAKGYTPKWVAP